MKLSNKSLKYFYLIKFINTIFLCITGQELLIFLNYKNL